MPIYSCINNTSPSISSSSWWSPIFLSISLCTISAMLSTRQSNKSLPLTRKNKIKLLPVLYCPPLVVFNLLFLFVNKTLSRKSHKWRKKRETKNRKDTEKLEKIKDVKIKLSFTIHAKHIKHIETLQIYLLFFSFFLLRRVSFILDQNSLILSIGEGCSTRGCKTVSKSSKRMKPTHRPSRRFSIPL